MTAAQTAAEYRDRYKDALEHNALTQGAWHTERDGRHLACALGVIGEGVKSPSDCPAQIMPRWLAQMVPGFFDRQKQDDAFAWGMRFTEVLARLNGDVPFSVIHDWHANTVCPLGIDAAERLNRDPSPHKALQALHSRAVAGEKITADEWKSVLKDAYACADAYAYADADADAYAYAYAYAYADADADAYANANANANANADAYAGANADAYAYADAYANACAYANADAWKRLAGGMVDALERAAGQ